MDEIEEEAYNTLDADGAETIADSIISEEMMLSLSSIDHKMNRPRIGTAEMDRLTKEEQKMAEEERKIAENGPYLEPGIVNHICVVGPSGEVSPNLVKGHRGWLGENIVVILVFVVILFFFSFHLILTL